MFFMFLLFSAISVMILISFIVIQLISVNE